MPACINILVNKVQTQTNTSLNKLRSLHAKLKRNYEEYTYYGIMNNDIAMGVIRGSISGGPLFFRNKNSRFFPGERCYLKD